jgi:hypothetical protein
MMRRREARISEHLLRIVCFRISALIPKPRHRHNEFKRNLRLAHKAGAQARHSAKQFLPRVYIFKPDDLINFRGGRQKNQRSMIIHNDGVRRFRYGMFVDVLKSHNHRDPRLPAPTAPPILRPQIARRYDSHAANLASIHPFLKFQS